MEPWPDEPAQYLVERVRETLAHDPRVTALDIRVTIKDRRIFLGGHVATPARRAAVSEVVRDLLPGYDIHNHIVAGEYPEPDHEEHLP